MGLTIVLCGFRLAQKGGKTPRGIPQAIRRGMQISLNNALRVDLHQKSPPAQPDRG
jgi:hypothetical protein